MGGKRKKNPNIIWITRSLIPPLAMANSLESQKPVCNGIFSDPFAPVVGLWDEIWNMNEHLLP